MKRKNLTGREKVIEHLRDQLFVAIKEHDLWKAEECMAAAHNRQVKKNEIFNYEKYGMKVVSFAVKENSLEILKFLVENGANSNAVSSENSRAALHVAAEYGREEAGQFLLNHGANINSIDAMGKTPLYLASFHCQLKMVGLLIHNNANPNMRDLYSLSALDVIGDNPKVTCNDQIKQKIVSVLKCAFKVNCKKMLANTGNLKVALEASDNFNDHYAATMASSAAKPFSFINSIFSWARATISATSSSLFSNAPVLPCAQQPFAGEIGFSETTRLADVMVRKFTGEKYSRPLDDSLLTIGQIKERKLNPLERDVKIAISKCEKLYQCPGSSLNNSAVYSMHQKSL